MGNWLHKRLESILDNAIFAGVVAVIFAVWSYLKTLPAPIITLVAIISFASILLILRILLSFLDRRKVIRTTKMANTGLEQPIANERKYAGWMTDELNRDLGTLPSCVKACNLDINWHHLIDTDSYFELNLNVYSSSVLKVNIGKRIVGHLRYGKEEKEEFERSPEIMKPIEQLKRSDERRLTLRQWVSQSMMNKITLDSGKEIVLDFSTVDIRVDTNLPDGSQGPNCRLVVPNQFSTRLPTRFEIENQ